MIYHEYKLSLKEWIIYLGIGIVLCALVAYLFYRNLIAFFLFLPFGIYYPIYKKKDLIKQRYRTLKSEFKEAVIILSSFLRAGYSVENAMAETVQELNVLYGGISMMEQEFSQIWKKIKMKTPVEQAMLSFATRSMLDDIQSFAEVFGLAIRSGDDLIKIIRQTTDVIREKIQIEEEIIIMTSAKVFEQKIMSVIPFAIILYIDITSFGFFNHMYLTLKGRIIMTICLVIYIAAYIISKKIMEIEV